MYLAETLTVLTRGWQTVFDGEYPIAQFRGLHVDPDYPVEKENYPGIWVDFEPAGTLEPVGIGHHERPSDISGNFAEVTRWRFQGDAALTVVSLSSLERAMLMDEVIKTIAFGKESAPLDQLRTFLRDQALIALDLQWDQITITGQGQAQGTPWGTDQVVYEITARIGAIGEFVAGVSEDDYILVPLSEVRMIEHRDGEPDPTASPPYSDDPGTWL